MLPLLELQRSMRRAVLDGDDAIAALVEGPAPQDRIAVHRNNTFASLTAALGDTFPVVRRLVDERFFAYAAHEFIRSVPPDRACLSEYGARFAAFLANFPPCRDFAYLTDVARLEWLLHQAATAQDGPALEPSALRAVSPDDTPRLLLDLRPSRGYLASRFPVNHIWRANQDCAHGGDGVDLASGRVHLEVARLDGEVAIRALPESLFAFRAAIRSGVTLAAAAEAALARDPAFDLTGALSGLFAERAVVDLRLEAVS